MSGPSRNILSDLLIVAYLVTQLLPVGAALSGVALRLVGLSTMYDLLQRIEDVFSPLHLSIGQIHGVEDLQVLVEPARELIGLRDELIRVRRASEFDL